MSCQNPTIPHSGHTVPAEEVVTFLNDLSPLVGRAKVLAEASQYLARGALRAHGQPDALPCGIAILEAITELMAKADEELDRLSDFFTRATAPRSGHTAER